MAAIVPVAGGIGGAGGAAPIALPAPIAPAGGSSGAAFQDVLTGAINQVEAFGKEAAASTQRFLSGEGEELHTTIMAAQRAELSFDLFLQVRNKVVSAYQEIMKMQM
jgi:flagellar hook-basal body complex protein FliE